MPDGYTQPCPKCGSGDTSYSHGMEGNWAWLCGICGERSPIMAQQRDLTENLNGPNNPCPNCESRNVRAYWDNQWYPWTRTEECRECGLEWLCVGTPQGSVVIVLSGRSKESLESLRHMPVCENCQSKEVYWNTAEDCFECRSCGFIESVMWKGVGT